jgi:hypothetical protein
MIGLVTYDDDDDDNGGDAEKRENEASVTGGGGDNDGGNDRGLSDGKNNSCDSALIARARAAV